MNFEFGAPGEQRGRVAIELAHVRTPRTGGRPAQQRFHCIFIALHVELDGVVTPVADPTDDAKPGCLAAQRVAEADALNVTDDGAVYGASRHAARAPRHAP